MKICESERDFADFFPLASDAGSKDRRFREAAHGLFDGRGNASKANRTHRSFPSDQWRVSTARYSHTFMLYP
jgi:hypothetical protein